ncbi:MAG: hypothetical protein ACOCQR_02255 [bacterium]
MKVLDDDGKIIQIGDYVADYYNLADGVDPRGDRVSYKQIADNLELEHLADSQDSKRRIVEKISKEEYLDKIR